MRFKGRLELERGLQQIDIAPLINVLFLLLIFFMLTSSFLLQPGIKIHLPKSVTSEAVQHENIPIEISAENTVFYNSTLMDALTLNALFGVVAKANKAVLIKADIRCSLGKVAEVWEMARSSGIAQVTIATSSR